MRHHDERQPENMWVSVDRRFDIQDLLIIISLIMSIDINN